jgi:Na+-translocating ferredoxin:NAD+ oxidoreductase subunit D
MNEQPLILNVAASPHIAGWSQTTRRMMLDVLIALLPVVGVAVWVFEWYAVKQMAIGLMSAMGAEFVFTALRRRPVSLGDGSAAVTGLILGLSMPGPAPWYAGCIAGFVAIGIGKAVFGGLGFNLFNPAMVGRAFVMIAFAGVMGAGAYQLAPGEGVIDVMTSATPLALLKAGAVDQLPPIWHLFIGDVNGSLGETSHAACLLGGLYLCLRRTAAYEIPLAAFLTVGLIALLAGPAQVVPHLMGGAFLFGAFFIATDPVSSPVTPRGKWIFGAGFGAVVMLLRLFSGYPEGVMFAVLIMNGFTPLINRATIPVPLGGTMPERK